MMTTTVDDDNEEYDDDGVRKRLRMFLFIKKRNKLKH